MKALIGALLKTKKVVKNATKDKTNPHLKNEYATLESVLEAITDHANANGLVFIQYLGKDESGQYLETALYHESGESHISKLYLILDKTTMQGLGSAITYARRYSLTALFGIGQEDDDGNAASNQSKPQLPVKKDFAPRQAPPAAINAAPSKSGLIQVEAIISFEDKQMAKDSGFRYNAAIKKWTKEIRSDEIGNFPFEVRELK